MTERTLVLLKPDTITRGLVGEVIKRFERVGLKVLALKMLQASDDQINQHYPPSRREFVEDMGRKTLENNQQAGIDTKDVLGTDDPYEIGLQIQSWNVNYLKTGPIIALVLQGPHAISLVRKLRGPTLPINAPPGTINGDYSFDSSNLANPSKRSLRNLVHASGNTEEAEHEIAIWFSNDELHQTRSIHQEHMLE